jgi:hypothetical protein
MSRAGPGPTGGVVSRQSLALTVGFAAVVVAVLLDTFGSGAAATAAMLSLLLVALLCLGAATFAALRCAL